MSSDKFLRGAMILTLAGLMVKVIGSVNRILLSRLLGGEGIGLYQMAYPVYLLLLAVSAAGIPIAISITVAGFLAKKDYANVNKVFSVSLRLMAAVGLVLALLLVAVAGWLVDAGIIRDARAYYALVALTPAVFFGSILASFRGYFQGYQLMTPPAVSQIVEQLVRVVTMVVLAYVLLPQGLEYAAAGAAFGAVPGSLTGLVVLGCFYRYYRKRWMLPEDGSLTGGQSVMRTGTLIKQLLLLALPVSCANVLVPVTSSIDVLLVPRRLVESGWSVVQATAMFGYLAGMAQPLLLMATIPTMSLATSLVPAVSEAVALRQHQVIKTKTATAMKLCCLWTLPASVGMAVLAWPISQLLYGTQAAGMAIMHSAPAIWLLGLQQVTTGMLQGMGHTNLPMLNMLIGIAAKIISVYWLTNAQYGIAGAAWATNINFGLTALLNIVVLHYFNIRFIWRDTIKIFAVAALMGAAAWELHSLLAPLGQSMAAVMSLASAAVIYALLLPLSGLLKKQELEQLPFVKSLLGKCKYRKKA